MTFIRLVDNELMKINSKRNTWIFIIFLAVAITAIGIVIKLWIKEAAEGMNYLSFSSMALSILYLFVLIFAIVLGARTITEEFKDGTIKQLLIRPASRSMILLSKYVSIFVVILGVLLFLMLFSLAMGAIIFGGHAQDGVSWMTLLKTCLYKLPYLIFFITFSFMIGVVTGSMPLSITISMVANSLGSALTFLGSKYDWTKYVIFNNLNWQMYEKEPAMNEGIGPSFPGMSLSFSITVFAAYIFVFLFVSIFILQKKDIR